uniref:Sugar phosphate transporter domain-containing protein n=1 Tax=Romanomermis culicivorax TaxID=13658 RepID=A0A915IDK5_ROMCU
MIFGAIVAASDDFTFNFIGYLLILINDLATAANGICTKMKLNARDLGKDGLLFYNALLMLPFLVLFTIFVDDLEKVIFRNQL